MKYYVNKNAQANGDHEVHALNCAWLPSRKTVSILESSPIVLQQLRRARRYYSQVDGCAHCSPNCHTQ